MKNIFFFLLLSGVSQASMLKTERKAIVTCDFKTFITWDQKVEQWSDAKLSYRINLDSKEVEVSCVGSEECIIDGSPRKHRLVTRSPKDSSFVQISKAAPNGNVLIWSNMPALNIEGHNGDDMDMFTRLTFGYSPDEKKLVADAVLIYADEGNDGYVSSPTPCSVDVFK